LHAAPESRAASLLLRVALLVLAPATAAGAGARQPGVDEKACTGCHDPGKLDGGGPFQHRPVTAGDCASCHEPHGPDEPKPKPKLRREGDALCAGCHRVQGRRMRTPHPPMEKGCRSCHSPHASRNGKLLATTVAALCRSCHPRAGEPREGGGRVHVPAAVGECTSCHDAHGSDLPAMMKARQDRVCYWCHSDAEPRFVRLHTHAPVLEGSCGACHSGHAGAAASLLAAPPAELCQRCHAELVERRAATSHRALAGECLDCHDAHGSNVPGMLREDRAPDREARDEQPAGAAGEPCAACHEAIAGAAEKAPFAHPPARKACVGCHEPHGSAKGAGLLKREVPALCAGCHPWDRAALAKRHMGYPVSGSRCTSCHDPHGSQTRGMLWDGVHAPVAGGDCRACHEAPTAKAPLAPRRAGLALCRDCHGKMLSATLARSHLHQPVAEGACLACHDPHGSSGRGLVAANLVSTCGRCHADTIERQRRSRTKHPPIREGRCTACHEPHASDQPLLFTGPRPPEQCRTCHTTQGHRHQPGGFRDQRNPNLQLECLSCHRAHGTEYDHLLPVPRRDLLCARCHAPYKG
jgi:predicted CXXCH cytochrome family protein